MAKELLLAGVRRTFGLLNTEQQAAFLALVKKIHVNPDGRADRVAALNDQETALYKRCVQCGLIAALDAAYPVVGGPVLVVAIKDLAGGRVLF